MSYARLSKVKSAISPLLALFQQILHSVYYWQVLNEYTVCSYKKCQLYHLYGVRRIANIILYFIIFFFVS